MRWQEETRDDPEARVAFSLDLVLQKVRNTLDTLETHVPYSALWDKAFDDITNRAKWLENRPPLTIGELRGTEGAIALDYFRAWSGISLKWHATNRYPIPDDWRAYGTRSALRDGEYVNRRATHPVNAMLTLTA